MGRAASLVSIGLICSLVLIAGRCVVGLGVSLTVFSLDGFSVLVDFLLAWLVAVVDYKSGFVDVQVSRCR